MPHKSLAARGRTSEHANRRSLRDEQARLRRLEREAKQQAKTSALEDARLQVAIHEAYLSMLLSIHKEQENDIDWLSVSVAAAPVPPERARHNELRANQDELLAAAGFSRFSRTGYPGASADARRIDDKALVHALEEYEQARADWLEERSVAERVLAGDASAYREVVDGEDFFAGNPEVSASAHVVVHDRHTAEVRVTVKGMAILPVEAKTLTSSGKLSAKPMPKGRFHETYQDYVCSAALRAGRELFGVLPVECAIVTASIAQADPPDEASKLPVLSVILFRKSFLSLPFDTLDPSDTIESLPHRGDVKLSRRSASFTSIVPFGIQDLPRPTTDTHSLEDTFNRALSLRLAFERELTPPTGTTADAAVEIEE